jgi:hypothetical protein
MAAILARTGRIRIRPRSPTFAVGSSMHSHKRQHLTVQFVSDQSATCWRLLGENTLLSNVAFKPPARRYRTAGGIELPRIDARLVNSKRFRQLCEAFEAELGGNLNVIEQGLVTQACSLQIRIEALQSAIVAGADVDADQIIRLSSEHRRLLTSLRGKAARRQPPAPTLQDHLARRAAARAEADAE